MQSMQVWNNFKYSCAASKLSMLKSGQLTIADRTMKFVYKTKGNRPPNGYSLIFGFHGGGGCPANVNDQQHQNHKCLYDKQLPNGAIWFTPRSIENVYDMWFRDYMEDFILEIIHAFLVNDMIDANKVFLTGYSAGGDGVYHLAPRMADYIAGAAMMAGHPNGINFMNVRNIAFSLQVGELDDAYNRHHEAIKYSRMLAQLQQNYGGYENRCKVQKGKPHWMDRQDTQIFDWLFSFTRNPYPELILFKQCPRRSQKTFYYLRIGEPKNKNTEQQTVVVKQGNIFNITSNRTITVLINSKMVNPSQPIVIIHNNAKTSQRMMQSKPQVIEQTLLERSDPYYIFEDQFVSSPPQIVDIKATICDIFDISVQHKDSEFECPLPMESTPDNFNMKLEATLPRTKPLHYKGKWKRASGIGNLINPIIPNIGIFDPQRPLPQQQQQPTFQNMFGRYLPNPNQQQVKPPPNFNNQLYNQNNNWSTKPGFQADNGGYANNGGYGNQLMQPQGQNQWQPQGQSNQAQGWNQNQAWQGQNQGWQNQNQSWQNQGQWPSQRQQTQWSSQGSQGQGQWPSQPQRQAQGWQNSNQNQGWSSQGQGWPSQGQGWPSQGQGSWAPQQPQGQWAPLQPQGQWTPQGQKWQPQQPQQPQPFFKRF